VYLILKFYSNRKNLRFTVVGTVGPKTNVWLNTEAYHQSSLTVHSSQWWVLLCMSDHTGSWYWSCEGAWLCTSQ